SVSRLRPDARLQGVIIEEMCLRPHARELMLGVVSDPVFGPIISVGMGGTAVEALGDRAVTLPPINHYLARDLIKKTRASKLLAAFRNLPEADMAAVENLLLRVSEMVCELPWLKEMDINPVLVDDRGVVAVDARMVIDRVPPTAREYDHMAIHPYPTRLVSQETLADGTEVVIRPIRPEDAVIEQDFVRALSGKAKYYRFMHALEELPPVMLSRLTQIDYDREMALIVTTRQDDSEKEIGVARYVINPDGESCEFAIVIADDWQERGLGTRLMNRLMNVARERGLRVIQGEVLRDNRNMLMLMEGLGFRLEPNPETHQVMNVNRRL
ncbi:MAG: GNAT family N-acetyltransferase, partial [Candidatus Competibacterales bacterium]|nr:GNAT family N-acetyltransferase [Candidatus Competibacterales bacterium]